MVDPARAEVGRGRDLADGQLRLVGFDDGPDPLAPGFFQAFRGEAEAGGELLLAPDLLIELIVGFRPCRLCIRPAAVQQTGQLMAGFWSNASRRPAIPIKTGPSFGG